MTLREVLTQLVARRTEYVRLRAQVEASALLDDVIAMLERVDGTETAAGRDLTTRQAAERLGIRSHRTIERFCREGRFPSAYRTSGATGEWRIPGGDVAEFGRRSGRGAELRGV